MATCPNAFVIVLFCLYIPKGNKDTTCSQNYRPIALASSLSKVLERLILMKYESFFYSNSLQFGFQPGFSIPHCVQQLSLGTCIMVPMYWVVSWMPVKLLTWLIMAFFSRLSLTEVYLLQF